MTQRTEAIVIQDERIAELEDALKGRQVCPGAPWVVKAADLTGFTDRMRFKDSANTKPRSAGL